jgi:amidophosphoribosyltransferase
MKASAWTLEEKREECGIVAIYSKRGEDVAPYIYRALIALQHRGQDACGLAVYEGKGIEARKGVGLVGSVLRPEDLALKGRIGIGHTRYPTSGECRMCDVQPIVSGRFAVAHNGHLANYPDLRKKLEGKGCRFTSSVDSEAMVFMLEKEKDLKKAASGLMRDCEGSFSLAMIAEGKLAVLRDPFAMRPLVWGEDERFICFASETVALDYVGVPYKGDVAGGELVVVEGGRLIRTRLVEAKPRHCMFEYVYFSRPDSTLDGRSVYDVRKRLGEVLAREAPANVDVVIPVPDTARTAAASFAAALGIPCEEGLIKNRYIGRTFIMPDQEKRKDAVRMKLNPVRELVFGKSVALVEDSIVRGTTFKEVVALVRKAGAKEVHLRITCPPIRAPCFYGVDMSTFKELIANKKTVGEIGRYLGADSLAYISIEGLGEAVGTGICSACLSGRYHTKYVDRLADMVRRSEKGK